MRVCTALVALSCLAGCRLEPRAPEAPPNSVVVPDPAAGADRPRSGASPAVPSDVTAEATVAERPGVVRAPSGLAIPVAGVAPSDLVDTYRQARSEGRAHDAIDIPAPRGTPVVAAARGPVLQLFTSDDGGLTVYQLGADRRTVYYYAHLDAYAAGLAAGQRLRPGDPVGTVGDTGNAAPGDTHLHFAVWRVSDPSEFWDGAPVNPYPLLAGRR